MGLVNIFRKNKIKNVPLPKIDLVVEICIEILAPVCSDDSIQILLKMAWIIKLTIQAYFRRIYMESSEQ